MEDKVTLWWDARKDLGDFYCGEGIMAQIQRESANKITYTGGITKKQLCKAMKWKASWYHHKRFKNKNILSVRNKYRLYSFECKSLGERIRFLSSNKSLRIK